MRLALAALLALHGAVHLIGFVKAFGLAEVAALREPISRPAGALWLTAAVALIASAALVPLAPRHWWALAAPAVLLSQWLIVASWGDAKFGTLANVILLVPVTLAALDLRPSSPRSRYERESEALLARSAPARTVTEADLAPLPPLVQRYLRRAGVVGSARARNFRAVFRAQMRSGRDGAWMSATVEQHSFYDEPARLFFMTASRTGVPFDGFHRYVGPHATMEVRLLGLARVVDARGPEMDQSETVTLFNDLCFFAPSALVDAPVEWEPAGDHAVRATYRNAGHTVHAELSFDPQGDLVGFVSRDRYLSADGRSYRLLPWSTPVIEHRSFGGYRLPARAEARWVEPDGEWTYGRFELVEIAYNLGPR